MKAMDNRQHIEVQLWDYIDGLCDAAQQTTVEKLIAENAQWKSKYHELLELHQLIHTAGLEQPSLRFTKNVMEEISRLHIAPAAKAYINKNVVWGIAAFFLTVILSFVIYGIAEVDWTAGTSGTSVGNGFTIDYSKMWNNTYLTFFMMGNVVLALMLLDKYLTGKKKKLLEG
jgi:hypothetical protein